MLKFFQRLLRADRKLEKVGMEKRMTFLEVGHEYLQKHSLEAGLSPATIYKNRCLLMNIETFLQKERKYDITVGEVTAKFMEQFKLWLLSERKCGMTHVSRHIEFCKCVAAHAVLMGYIEFSAIATVKCKRTSTKDVIHLELEEIEKLANASLQNPIYHTVRDLYLFQCFTGLSYADLYRYEVIDRQGKLWITGKRHKTGKPYHIPVFERALQIHTKYKGKLPLLGNAVYNRMLKELAAVAGINKRLTSHTGRKTFATIMDQEGLSTKSIADMLANTPDICHKHYLGNSHKRIENELEKLGLVSASAG